MNTTNLKITEEEIKSLIDYTGISHKQINSLLSSDLSNEYSYLLDNRFYFPLYEKDVDLVKDIDQILFMYSAMVKMSYINDISKYKLYRGTSTSNIKQSNIGFISTTFNKDMAKHYFTSSFKENSKVLLNIKPLSNVPYFVMNSIEDYKGNYEDEVILSPFLSLNYKNKIIVNNFYEYDLELTRKELKNSDVKFEDISIIRTEAIMTLKELISLKKEVNNLYNDYICIQKEIPKVSLEEKKMLFKDIEYIDGQITELNNKLSKKELIYINFKQKVQDYIQKECLVIEQKIENELINSDIRQR